MALWRDKVGEGGGGQEAREAGKGLDLAFLAMLESSEVHGPPGGDTLWTCLRWGWESGRTLGVEVKSERARVRKRRSYFLSRTGTGTGT